MMTTIHMIVSTFIIFNLYDLSKDKYEVLSWTEGLSSKYITEGDKPLVIPQIGLDENGIFKEPEVIWYPEINALGTQGHPEWGPGRDALNFLNDLIRERLTLS